MKGMNGDAKRIKKQSKTLFYRRLAQNQPSVLLIRSNRLGQRAGGLLRPVEHVLLNP